MKQITLTNDKVERKRIRPNTFIHCRTCDEWILRSRRREHDGHTLRNKEGKEVFSKRSWPLSTMSDATTA